ncbi:39S ribosomal protein L4, mitochondrial-like [Panonychus citri]|uniref:39S ribosomal protein L4, mitochondrial-like n=1 Tax=Panonychus citri TaxID=50023 RepID=UPI002306E73C|nr:39S ribosomal protein L4, mitochondrial-like [Panonychus citri]
MFALRQVRTYCVSAPLILPKEYGLRHSDIFNAKVTPPKESWLYNFDTLASVKLGLVGLHPKVFSAFPRPDLIAMNVIWQQKYRKIDWLKMKTRAEFRTLNKKPWPQKGTGRARHGSRRSPQFTTGGWSHGPRGPKTSFFMLPYFNRVVGLISTITCKFAQNDIKIVDTLESFPSDDPQFLKEMIKTRGWGPSVLIADTTDIFPKNLALASHGIDHINCMPTYSLNVYSMLKHETLVLTYSALRELEEKLLFQLNRTDLKEIIGKYEAPKVVPNYPNTDPILQP